MEISQSRFGVKQVLIMILTLTTAGVHFSLLFPDLMFILNGLGYLGLMGAYYLRLSFLKPYRRLIRLAWIGFTLLTIVLWVVMGERSILGYTDKIVEALLVGLLIFERP